MKNFIQNIAHSLNNDKSGYSGKKLTVVAIMICVIVAHVKWVALGDFSQLITVLTVDYATVLTLMGINVYDKKANGGSKTTLEQTATVDSSETILTKE